MKVTWFIKPKTFLRVQSQKQNCSSKDKETVESTTRVPPQTLALCVGCCTPQEAGLTLTRGPGPAWEADGQRDEGGSQEHRGHLASPVEVSLFSSFGKGHSQSSASAGSCRSSLPPPTHSILRNSCVWVDQVPASEGALVHSPRQRGMQLCPWQCS